MVNRADINSVLMQMRQVRQQVQPTQAATGQPGNVNAVPQSNFANHLNSERSQMLNQVQQKQEVTQAEMERQALGGPVAQTPLQTQNSTPAFREMMGDAINTVNANQKHAGDMSTRFTQGDPNVDLPEVMVALQKSSVSFQAMTQVRNKLLEAYKDIMNMPV